MFRALWIKEWAQLRALRWVGFGLGVLLPLALLAGAEAGRQGWSPMARVASYDHEALLLEAWPLFLAALWGLLALLVACQSFVGDRAAGTESFLLERPVARTKIWAARLVAVLGSTSLLLIGHLALWGAVSQIALDPGRESWSTALRILLPLGIGCALLCMVAGIGASALARSPMQAVLVGLLLAVVPPVLAMALSRLFPFAAYRNVLVGLVVPGLLVVGYLGVSFVVSCRGEPAGRWRWARALTVFGVSVVLVPIVFGLSAPLAMRLDAARGVGTLRVAVGPSATAVAVPAWGAGAGWLLDLEARRKTRFLAPPVLNAAWNADQSRLAVALAAGALGSHTGPRVEILDRDGRTIRKLERDLTFQHLDQLIWSGEWLVFRTWGVDRGWVGLLIVSIETGEARTLSPDTRSWRLLGPTVHGELFVLQITQDESAVLRRLDVERARLDPQPVFEDLAFADLSVDRRRSYLWRSRLTPSGRFFVRADGRVQNLQTGELHQMPAIAPPTWLDDDRALWLADDEEGTGLFLGGPGREPQVLRHWKGKRIRFTAAPGGARLLVEVFAGEEPEREVPASSWELLLDHPYEELWIYDIEGGRWADALEEFEIASRSEPIQWAGPATVSKSHDGFLAIESLGRDPWYVIGEP